MGRRNSRRLSRKSVKRSRRVRKQKAGAGFSFDLGDKLGGLARVTRYATHGPPAYVQAGGKKKLRRTKKTKKTKRRTKKNSKRKTVKGGSADYPKSVTGKAPVWTPNMKLRTFAGKQPLWTPRDF